MSSHHIVREKQEPALLIMSLNGFSTENLGQLLEWSPTVIVAEEMYDHTESLGIKIDGVVTSNPDFMVQENTLIILCGDNPLEDALKHLIGEQYPAVNIITAGFALKEYALYVDDINLVIFNPTKKIFPVRPGFSKWQASGEQVEILNMPQSLSISGLKRVSGNMLQTNKDGFYSMSFNQPFIFIAETI